MVLLPPNRSAGATIPSFAALFLALTALPLHAEIVINEIMYHPLHAANTPEPFAEEFLELHNTDPARPVDLAGWSLVDGVAFTFPPVAIPPNGYLVVSADPHLFGEKYPGLSAMVVGPWTGRLSNDGERIRLVDNAGQEVDEVSYHDDGDWAQRRRGPLDRGHRGWTWTSGADRGGSSLELRNARLSNKQGQNWADSVPNGGTPGAPNSRATTDLPPIITDVSHHPALPSSSDLVRIRARLRDEQGPAALSAVVRYRVSSTRPEAFSEAVMHDDGFHDDELPNDGIFAATLPAYSDGAIIEFYVEAHDGGQSNTWPSSTDDSGAQGANALYAVEDSPVEDEREVYRLILSVQENNEFAHGNFNTRSDAQMNATFIAARGDDYEVRYRAGLRRRGAGSRNDNPRTMRLNLPGESAWDGVTALNLNGHFGYLQVFGHKLFAASGLAGARGRPVRLLINGDNEANSSSRDHGYYAHMEPQNSDSLDRQFPDDGGGNLYRKRRPDTQLAYRNGNLGAYLSDGWDKNSNSADWDWRDLDALLGALHDTGNPNYLVNLRTQVDVEQWLRWFAVMTLLNNGETNISNGADDDYYMYRGVDDSRFKLIPHDLDTILGVGDGSAISNPQNTIFDMVRPGGNGRGDALAILEPFIFHPDVLPRYYHHLHDLIETSFSKATFDRLARECLDIIPSGQRDAVISYMDQRRAYVRSIVEPPLTLETGLSIVSGFPRTTSASLSSVSGMAPVLGTATVLVNGETVTIDPVARTWRFGGPVPVTLVPLGATWKYLDNGSDQGSAWREDDFDDEGWKSGPAQLGYGDGDEATVIGFGEDPENKHLTSYFRHEFEVTNAERFASLQLRVQYDDGFAALLNRRELARENLAPDAGFDDPATDFVRPEDEDQLHTYSAPVWIRSGSNMLAVEVHQFAPDNPDLSFDLELSGLLPGPSVDLDPGINKVTVQSFDRDGGLLASETVSVWYDDGNEEPLSGILPGDTILTAADGPYRVTRDLTVPSGRTLTIEPGTTIYFEQGRRLTVQGRLLAEGTEFRPIHLTRAPGSGDTWDGIYFDETGEDNRMTHVFQSFSTAAGHSTEVTGSRVIMDHVSWTDTTETVLEVRRPQLVVSNCVFPPTDGNEVIHGTDLSGSDYFILEGCFFNTSSGYNDIIDFSGGRRPGPIIQVRNNFFNGGTDDCLDLDGIDAHIEGNVFQNIHTDDPSRPSTSNAIATDGDAHLTIVRNIFHDVDHALLLKNGSDAVFENNVVVGATLGAINFREPLRPDVDAGSDLFARGNIFHDNTTTFRFPDHPQSSGRPPNIVANNNILPETEHSFGTGNLDADPGFLDPARNDFRLIAGSPARGSGIKDNDMGADVPAGALLSGIPPRVTPSDHAEILVHIAGISGIESGSFTSTYRWQINGLGWSDETPVDLPITLDGLPDGDYLLEVVAKDSAGLWQDESMAATASWTVDSTRSPLRINELLADNRSAFQHAGSFPDYVELINAGSVGISLSGMSLTDDPLEPDKFVFAPGTTIAPGEQLLLHADSDPTAPGIHLGFALNAGGESITLLGPGGEIVDSISFGPQAANFSIGRTGSGGTWGLNLPTPGQENQRMGTATPARLRINEWLAASSQVVCDDFIELYNPQALPVHLGGLFLTDDPGVTSRRHEIPPLSFIAANGFRAFWASNEPSRGPVHLDFSLDADAEWAALYDADGNAIDLVPFTGQRSDQSVGLFPDGGTATVSYPIPTPGLTNSQAGQPIIETVPLRVLDDVWAYEQSDSPLPADWVSGRFDDSSWPRGQALLFVEEDFLPGPKNTPLTLGAQTYYFRSEFDFSGALSDTQLILQTVLDDGAVIYLNGTELFRLGMDGPVDHNSDSSRAVGNAEFEGPFTLPSDLLNVGRNVLAVEVHQTDAGSSDIVFGLTLDAVTTNPPAPDPAYQSALRLLTGLRISEIMYDPDDGSEHEFIELVNISEEELDLTGLRFTDGIDFVFPAMTLAPGEYVLVVRDEAAFGRKYGFGFPVAGSYAGQLSNGGERIVLQLPEPFDLNIQKFEYDDAWYPLSDGEGHSLEIADLSQPVGAWESPAAWRTGVLQGSPGTAVFISAGPDRIAAHPTPVNLAGSASVSWSPDVQWLAASGPGEVAFSSPNSLQTTASFSLPGTYLLRLVGRSNGLELASGVTVTVDDRYASWQNRLGVVGGPFENDDQDPLLNIEEYAFDLDPFLPDQAPLPLFGPTEEGFAIEFRILPRKTDVRVELETSLDLIDWDPAPLEFVRGTPDEQFYQIRIDPVAVPRVFVRHAVQLLP